METALPRSNTPEPPVIVSVEDTKSRDAIARVLRNLASKITLLTEEVNKLKAEKADKREEIGMAEISRNLQSTGTNPLNLTGLRGVTSDPQYAQAPRYVSAPTGILLQQLRDSQLILVQNGSGYDLDLVIGGNPNTLVTLLSGIGSGAGLMTTNTAQNVTAVKTWTSTTGAIVIQPASAPAANTVFFNLKQTAGTNVTILDYEGDLYTRSLTLYGNAASTFLLTPDSAAAANTQLFRITTSAGVGVASVDAEGDAIFNSATIPTLSGNVAMTGTLDVTGNFSSTNGNITLTNGNLTLTNGDISIGGDIGASGFISSSTELRSTFITLGGSQVTIRQGTGSPETVVSAPVGSLYVSDGGGAGTTLYVKEGGGGGNTGWVGK